MRRSRRWIFNPTIARMRGGYVGGKRALASGDALLNFHGVARAPSCRGQRTPHCMRNRWSPSAGIGQQSTTGSPQGSVDTPRKRAAESAPLPNRSTLMTVVRALGPNPKSGCQFRGTNALAVASRVARLPTRSSGRGSDEQTTSYPSAMRHRSRCTASSLMLGCLPHESRTSSNLLRSASIVSLGNSSRSFRRTSKK